MKHNYTAQFSKIIITFILSMVFLAIPHISAKADVKLNDSVITQKEATGKSITFTFTPVDNGKYYKMLYSTDQVNWKEDDTRYMRAATAKIYLLEPATTYYIKVCTYNDINTEDITSESKPYALITGPDYVKNIEQVSSSTDSVTISWTPDAWADGYYVYRGSVEQGNIVCDVTNNSATLTGLKESDYESRSNYSYYVVSYKRITDSYTATSIRSDVFYAYVNPKKVTNLKEEEWLATTNEAHIKWDEQAYSSGYEIQILNIKDKVIKNDNIEFSSHTTYKFKNKSVKATGFIFRIRPYRTEYNKNLYGEWNEIVCVPSPKITKLKKSGTNSAVLKWNEVKGAKNYTIYAMSYAGNGKVSKKKVAKVGSKTTKYTIKNLSGCGSGYYRTIYFYVQANKVKVKGKKYNSYFEYMWYYNYKKIDY